MKSKLIKARLAVALAMTALTGAGSVVADHAVIITPDGGTPSRIEHDTGHSRGHRTEGHSTQRRNTRTTGPVYRQRDQRAAREIDYRRPYLTPYIGGGVGSGGDVVGRFTDNFGDTERVRSGGGFLIEGGVLAAIDRSTMVRLTAGYEIDGVGRSNGDSTFDRVRFDGMLLRNFHGHEFGVGLTSHVGVGYQCDINSVCAGSVDFENALGYTLEYALSTLGNRYGFVDNRRSPLRTARVGLRFTDIEYTPEFGQTTASVDDVVDGKSLSLFFGLAF